MSQDIESPMDVNLISGEAIDSTSVGYPVTCVAEDDRGRFPSSKMTQVESSAIAEPSVDVPDNFNNSLTLNDIGRGGPYSLPAPLKENVSGLMEPFGMNPRHFPSPTDQDVPESLSILQITATAIPTHSPGSGEPSTKDYAFGNDDFKPLMSGVSQMQISDVPKLERVDSWGTPGTVFQTDVSPTIESSPAVEEILGGLQDGHFGENLVDSFNTERTAVQEQHLDHHGEFLASGIHRRHLQDIAQVRYGSRDDLNRAARDMATVVRKNAFGIILEQARGKIMLNRGDYRKDLDYKESRMIGRGGQGKVYLAEDLMSNHLFCIKEILADYRPEEVATMTRLLSQKGIVQIYGAVKIENSVLILMEYLEGVSLSKWISEREKLQKEQIMGMLALFLQLLDILVVLKSYGVLHEDIKALNIVVTKRNGLPHLHLIDFGAATFSPMSTPGRMGTVTHFSPEKAIGDDVHDHEADVYAAVTTLYQMLIGRAPFENCCEMLQVIFSIGCYGPPFKQLPSWLPLCVKDIFLKGWSEKPHERASAETLRDDVCRILTEGYDEPDVDDQLRSKGISMDGAVDENDNIGVRERDVYEDDEEEDDEDDEDDEEGEDDEEDGDDEGGDDDDEEEYDEEGDEDEDEDSHETI